MELGKELEWPWWVVGMVPDLHPRAGGGFPPALTAEARRAAFLPRLGHVTVGVSGRGCREVALPDVCLCV